ncbi:TPA: hypothetical protein ACVOYM_004486 [Vibrio diabolicus]|uniref:hypothetical protein n=1 Tax=Vibrio harveyi group TaxID=717610 RepID=UPI000CA70F8A|nr:MULTISPECIES: hypothetical protein [Vibrio harveyi group]PLX58391.1 MAG: hypothetical protein C0632_18575 [Vibrio alginolyticus]EJI1399422.1 hypothetical protein [Vibrio parahaemolyticus]MCS0453490.1 hypothetical protein [Vibrio diabolicus]MCX8941443.1 hypothetical protein [Vibrio parahaemolyticus]MDF5576007.1 hypothetical protein [Vibrio parahaemolyticus]
MRIVIDGCNFNLESVSSLSRNKNLGIYSLQGVDDNLAKFAGDSIENKAYFDIEVLDKDRSVLVGEHCFFNDLNVLSKTLKLTVNWVEHSLFD